MHNFTPEDLVQFLYNETPKEKSEAIEAALENDWTLREMFDVIVSAQQRLKALNLAPREEAVNKILRHAEKSMSELHHQ